MPLTSISPLDGRYQKQTQPLAEFFSERALMRYRIIVEGEYLIALSELADLHADKQRGPARGLRKFSDKEKRLIRSLYNLKVADAQMIVDIERKGYKDIPATNHDVKAVEYFMKLKLAKTSLKDVLEWIHFGLTSYDINSPARGMMLSDGLGQVILPKIASVIQNIELLSKKYKSLPMLARTHGQPASPTTFGKEMKIFAVRLQKQLILLKSIKISAKLNGASGNYNAHIAAYPKVDWIKFSQKFISHLNSLSTNHLALSTNLFTTQIDPHDSEAEIFDCLRRVNTILIGFNQDMWRYISDEWLVQKAVKDEVGSSAMPHKINPINFENSEGNLGLANALLNHFAIKLPISRLQRDLSDSTVERNFGSALAYSLIAYENLLKGLARIEVNKNKIAEDLKNYPEVIAEAIQTVLRREGVKMPYEKLKELTRGKQITLADMHKFIDDLDINEKIKKELKKFKPENYTGLAAKLASI